MAIMRTGSVTRAIWPYIIQRGHEQESRYIISGITRDSAGAILGGCTVDLYEAATSLRRGSTISDLVTGYWEVEVAGDRSLTFFARAYLAGSPDVAGTTVNTLLAA